eukprot:CAMPEP_0114244002 /NCGR_PEP_ID=MMETSP0058-20121206/11101_1 /TAXON_ID=36894 /ORGANISM="Pyramimonas parkeae, CCMP726" /LENGTH=304 /DNA_ID=CAMNT_0001356901 /DNA_START=367 /DNA_END=1281 /DNA_ORIENTATION=+
MPPREQGLPPRRPSSAADKISTTISEMDQRTHNLPTSSPQLLSLKKLDSCIPRTRRHSANSYFDRTSTEHQAFSSICTTGAPRRFSTAWSEPPMHLQSHDGDSSQVNIPEWYMHIRARNKQAKHRASHKARKDDERINLLIEKQRVVELERAAAGKDVASQARRNASERRKERLATESLARFRTVSTAAVFSTAVQACARGGKASSGRAHSGSTSHGGATVGGGGATRGLGVAAAAKAAARKLQKAETQNMDTKVLQMLNELEEDEQQHLQWQPIDPKPLAAKTQEISMWIKPGVFLTKTIINA